MNCTVGGENGTLQCKEEAHDTRSDFEVVVEVGTLVLILVVGMFGNCLVITTVTRVKKLQSLSSSLIVNLSITDLLICGVVVPILLPARIYRKWLLGDTVCSIHGFMVFLSVYTSIFTFAAIAIVRMLKILFPNLISTVHLKRNSIIACLLLWTSGFLCACPPLLGWGRYVYDTKRDNCLFDRKAAPSYSTFLAVVGILVPIIITGVCYLVIFIRFLQQRKKVNTHLSASASRNEQFRLSRNLFLVWIFFVICWMPMNVMLFIDPEGLIARPYYIAAIWFLLCCSCVNPILYFIISRSFREGYKEVLKFVIGRNGGTSSTSSETRETHVQTLQS